MLKRYKIEPTQEEIRLLIKYLKLFPGWDNKNLPAEYMYACFASESMFFYSVVEPTYKVFDKNFSIGRRYDKGYWTVGPNQSESITLFKDSLALSKSELLSVLRKTGSVGNMALDFTMVDRILKTNRIKNDFLYIEFPEGFIGIYEPDIRKLRRISYEDILATVCNGFDEYESIRLGNLELPYEHLCKIKRGGSFEPLIKQLEAHYGIQPTENIKGVGVHVPKPKNIKTKPINPTGPNKTTIFVPFNVLSYRKSHALSQHKLAQMLNVSRSTYQHWERDGRLPVTIYETLIRG